jgi:protein-tyrosine phosphatase
MPAPFVIDVNSLDDRRDAVHRAVQGLAEGRLLVLPTETSYCFAANALQSRAVRRVVELRGGPELPVVQLKSPGEALDYAPHLSPLAHRLIRRCWPGPLQLRVQGGDPESVVRRFSPLVRELAFAEDTVQLTVSLNQFVAAILRFLPGPMLMWPAAPVGAAEPVTAQDVLNYFGGQLELLMDEGRCRFGQPASIVEIASRGLRVVRPGVISELALSRFSSLMITVVCTGNTCRSPMAEVLLKKRLAEKLGCKLEQLEERGVMVMSAGVAAMSGGRAAENAIEVMHKHGLDLSGHESQPLSDRMVKYADLLLTMTRGHREAILAQWPEAKDRTFTIGRERGDVSDPIGGSFEHYERCANQIDALVQQWVQEIELPGTTPPATA